MTIYFSSGAFPARHPAELLATARAEGISHIEWSAGMEDAPDFIAPIVSAVPEMRFLVHNYFPPPSKPFVLNLAELDDATHLQTMTMCRNAIDLCATLGAPFYSVHSGWAFRLEVADLGQPERQRQIADQQTSGVDVPKAYERFVASVRALSDYARQRGIRLLVENNVIAPSGVAQGKTDLLFNTTAQGIIGFLNDVQDANVGLLLDLAHLKVSANALQFDAIEALARLGSAVACLHLSDNDGQRDNNQPLHQATWFLPLLRDFRHVPWVIEAYRLSAAQRREQQMLLLSLYY